MNQNIDLERDFPECNLTKVTEIREAGEIIRAIWMHIVQSRKDANKDDTLEGFLQPCAVLADLESYFRQFVMCTVDRPDFKACILSCPRTKSRSSSRTGDSNSAEDLGQSSAHRWRISSFISGE